MQLSNFSSAWIHIMDLVHPGWIRFHNIGRVVIYFTAFCSVFGFDKDQGVRNNGKLNRWQMLGIDNNYPYQQNLSKENTVKPQT